MGVILGDPLTQPLDELRSYTSWPRTREGHCVECNAVAAQEHSWDCASSAIFADTVDYDMYLLIYNDIVAHNMTLTQTAIKCAECGKERLGKDLLVIYQAPLFPFMSQQTRDAYKYPHNIVKAVCPEHNRAGRVGYQRPSASGYGA